MINCTFALAQRAHILFTAANGYNFAAAASCACCTLKNGRGKWARKGAWETLGPAWTMSEILRVERPTSLPRCG